MATASSTHAPSSTTSRNASKWSWRSDKLTTNWNVRVAERTAELREKNEKISLQAELLDRTNRGLRELSVRLLHVQDDERRRIARDLHDGTGQALALLCMNLSALKAEADRLDSKLAQGLAENTAIVRQISTDLRTLSYLLHPPLLDEMGLESALRWYIDGFAQRSKIQVRLELPEGWGRLSRGSGNRHLSRGAGMPDQRSPAFRQRDGNDPAL